VSTPLPAVIRARRAAARRDWVIGVAFALGLVALVVLVLLVGGPSLAFGFAAWLVFALLVAVGVDMIRRVRR
jgi:hypothetical protein